MVERFIAGKPGGGYISVAEGMAGMARNRGGLVQKRFFNATAAAVIAAGIGACSSAPPAASPPGALPAGTARVTINNRTLPATTAVKCAPPIRSLTTITTGDTAAGITAMVSNENGLTAKTVSINDLDGFTGSYMEGLDGKTDVNMTGTTYIIRGTADGFDTDNPSMRTTATFAVQVAC